MDIVWHTFNSGGTGGSTGNITYISEYNSNSPATYHGYTQTHTVTTSLAKIVFSRSGEYNSTQKMTITYLDNVTVEYARTTGSVTKITPSISNKTNGQTSSSTLTPASYTQWWVVFSYRIYKN